LNALASVPAPQRLQYVNSTAADELKEVLKPMNKQVQQPKLDTPEKADEESGKD